MIRAVSYLLGWAVLLRFGVAAQSAALPEMDQRGRRLQTLDTPRSFPDRFSLAEWRDRAEEIRQRIVLSCGLWPSPERTPLNARVFDRVERDGYTVEKVVIETQPGFFLGGNLYRPMGASGPVPGILNPHGHWAAGRLVDSEEGSVVARCIGFARLGMVAFAYDMVGYNDTQQVGHGFGAGLTNELWGISLMGLQTWNSVRALDFLASLPDVDKSRLACTGASGGGTQTFILGAIDERLAAQAPVVMVSHSMQGGCWCENAPGLRVSYSNMEFAAAAAPRPQILVAASGDWTKETLRVEGPAIESVYGLFKMPGAFRYVRYDFGHNYNRTSREAVYEWFGRWLLAGGSSDVKEQPHASVPNSILRIWPDGKPPGNTLGETELIAQLMATAARQWRALKPKDWAGFEKARQELSRAWRHTLQVEFPEAGVIAEVGERQSAGGAIRTEFFLGRSGRGDRIPALLLNPARDPHRCLVVLVHAQGKQNYLDGQGAPRGLAKRLLEEDISVLLVDTFLTGHLADSTARSARQYARGYFTTYNRTDVQERVQDLITACAFAQAQSKGRKVVLCGSGTAGAWAALAAPVADLLVVDGNQADWSSDAVMAGRDLFVPGLRRIGTVEGPLSLAAPRPLLLHNLRPSVSTDWLRAAYEAGRAVPGALTIESEAQTDQAIAAWIHRQVEETDAAGGRRD